MRNSIYIAVLALGQMAYGASGCGGGHGDRNTMLVTTAWLAEHLSDSNLVVLGVGQKAEYDSGHIPGSLYVEYHETHLMQSPSGLSVELPSMAELAEAFGKLGVTNDSHVVLYKMGTGTTQTARVWVTLDAMGLGSQASILDGGFPVWQKEGRKVSTEVRAVKRGKLEPCAQNDVITDVAFVRNNLRHAGVDIIDARAKDFYTGVKVDTRKGHIPGSTSLPFEDLMDEAGKMKPAEALQVALAGAGAKHGERVVVYCHIGQRASVVYFAARYLGYDARLYDGSWEEWSRNKELPVEAPEK